MAAAQTELVPFGNGSGVGDAISLVAAGVVLLSVLTIVVVGRLDRLPVRSDAGVYLTEDGAAAVDLPAFVGTDWIGRRAEVTQVERDILPPDTGY